MPSANPAGVASPYTLQALACLTRLTWFNLSGAAGSSAVAAGLQHLTRLEGLECLGLIGCHGITDERLQALSALTGLTQLVMVDTEVQGSGLAALSRLQRLSLYTCYYLDAAGLAAVAQLTCLTYLDLSHSVTKAQPAELAQLAQLTNLQELRLYGHSIRDEAAALLELPRLGRLRADRLMAPQGQDLSGCAITQLSLLQPTVAADTLALPQLPALQSLCIAIAPASLSSISAQTQLTELAGWCRAPMRASELAAALRGLKQLQALELNGAECFDKQCLLAVAGLQQLQELWLDGGGQGLSPGVGECWGMLHRCTQLQRVTLQRCGPIIKGAILGLVFQVGMQQVVLTGKHGLAAEAVSELQELGAAQGCKVLCEEKICKGPLSEKFYDIPDW